MALRTAVGKLQQQDPDQGADVTGTLDDVGQSQPIMPAIAKLFRGDGDGILSRSGRVNLKEDFGRPRILGAQFVPKQLLYTLARNGQKRWIEPDEIGPGFKLSSLPRIWPGGQRFNDELARAAAGQHHPGLKELAVSGSGNQQTQSRPNRAALPGCRARNMKARDNHLFLFYRRTLCDCALFAFCCRLGLET